MNDRDKHDRAIVVQGPKGYVRVPCCQVCPIIYKKNYCLMQQKKLTEHLLRIDNGCTLPFVYQVREYQVSEKPDEDVAVQIELIENATDTYFVIGHYSGGYWLEQETGEVIPENIIKSWRNLPGEK